MRPRLPTALALSALWAAASVSAEPPSSAVPPAPFAVVELFTSEGCSSCPPADKLLSEFASQTDKNVFALSFHVDYWNYLGWADPFSRAEFSKRQEGYAQALGGRVYTPQMIVNGAEEFVGSQGGTARRSIAAALGQSAAAAITLEPVPAGAGAVRVAYRVTGHRNGDWLNVALVEKGLSVPVRRGENGGLTLKHENVVRIFRTVKLDASGSGRVDLELQAGARPEKTSLIAYAQQAGSLKILGASRAAFPFSPALPASAGLPR